MAMWRKCAVTKGGAQLLMRIIDDIESQNSTKGVEIFAAKYGESTVPDDDLKFQENVSDPEGTMSIIQIKHYEWGFEIVIRMDNSKLAEETVIKQVGFYARKKDSEESVLFAIAQDEVGDRVPSAEEMPNFNLEFTIAVALDTDAEISIVVDPTATATVGFVEGVKHEIAAQIEDLQEKVNPHLTDETKHITTDERSKWNGKTATTFTRTLDSGTKVGTITIEGIATDIYCEENTDTVYTHPVTSGNKHIPAGGASGQILKWAADGTAQWGDYATDIQALKTKDNELEAKVSTNTGNIATINNKLVNVTPNTFSYSSVKQVGDTVSRFFDNGVSIIGNVLIKEQSSNTLIQITALCVSDAASGGNISFTPCCTTLFNKLKEKAGSSWFLPIQNFSYKMSMINGTNIVVPNGATAAIGLNPEGYFSFYTSTNGAQMSFYVNHDSKKAGVVFIEFTL